MTDNPCFACTDRKVGCHIDCERRKEWLDAHLEKKRMEQKKRQAEGLIDDYVRGAKVQMTKHFRSRKRRP